MSLIYLYILLEGVYITFVVSKSIIGRSGSKYAIIAQTVFNISSDPRLHILRNARPGLLQELWKNSVSM
jgi:hypothetical protein